MITLAMTPLQAALEEAAVSVGLVYPTRPAIAAHIRLLKEEP